MPLDFDSLISNAKKIQPPLSEDIEELRRRVDYATLDEYDLKFIQSIENRLNKGYALN